MNNTTINKEFPIFNKLSINNLFHFGKMNITDKNTHSHEGNGLSVSICPFEWMRITKSYSATTFMLSKDNPMLLDFHKLPDKSLDKIIQWGINEKYINKINGFEYSYYDDEFECDLNLKFKTLSEALAEIGYDMSQLDKQELDSILEDNEITSCSIYEGTAKMGNELGWEPDISLALTYLITFYTEKVLNYDGVYWDDILDVSRLSAPRGMIFNSKISTFKITKFDTKSDSLKNIVQL